MCGYGKLDRGPHVSASRSSGTRPRPAAACAAAPGCAASAYRLSLGRGHRAPRICRLLDRLGGGGRAAISCVGRPDTPAARARAHANGRSAGSTCWPIPSNRPGFWPQRRSALRRPSTAGPSLTGRCVTANQRLGPSKLVARRHRRAGHTRSAIPSASHCEHGPGLRAVEVLAFRCARRAVAPKGVRLSMLAASECPGRSPAAGKGASGARRRSIRSS